MRQSASKGAEEKHFHATFQGCVLGPKWLKRGFAPKIRTKERKFAAAFPQRFLWETILHKVCTDRLQWKACSSANVSVSTSKLQKCTVPFQRKRTLWAYGNEPHFRKHPKVSSLLNLLHTGRMFTELTLEKFHQADSNFTHTTNFKLLALPSTLLEIFKPNNVLCSAFLEIRNFLPRISDWRESLFRGRRLHHRSQD